MSLDRAWIEAHVPQKGAMCLLDEVLSWDAQQVMCRSGTHRLLEHPLRAHGRLGSACAIEYAAQAAAVHGALRAGSSEAGRAAAASRSGVLASARAVELTVSRLDQLSCDLLIHAHCLHSDDRSALYRFSVSEQCATEPSAAAFARGRLALWLGV